MCSSFTHLFIFIHHWKLCSWILTGSLLDVVKGLNPRSTFFKYPDCSELSKQIGESISNLEYRHLLLVQALPPAFCVRADPGHSVPSFRENVALPTLSLSCPQAREGPFLTWCSRGPAKFLCHKVTGQPQCFQIVRRFLPRTNLDDMRTLKTMWPMNVTRYKTISV